MGVGPDGLEKHTLSTPIHEPRPFRQTLGFNDLPFSIRSNIYKYVLDTELVNAEQPSVLYNHALKEEMLEYKASRPPFPIQTSLFYVNKSVSREALQYFYSKNLFIRFEIYTANARHANTMLLDSGLLFTTAAPKRVEKSTQHALELAIVEGNSSHKRAAVMFPAQYLPRLIKFLDQATRASSSWAPRHSIFINVVNTHNFPISRLQGDLVEHFRLLSNVGAATIDPTNLLPQYADGLTASMIASNFEPTDWIKALDTLTNLADEARGKEEYILANEYGQTVIISMTYGYMSHAEKLHSQPEDFPRLVQRLRWRTELGIGISLSLRHRNISAIQNWLHEPPSRDNSLAAHELLLAEVSLSKALSLCTDSPSPTSNPWFLTIPVELIPPNKPSWFTNLEKAQTWYALGVVHMALGENLFAAGDLERALELSKGEDSEARNRIEAAFEKARTGIDGDAEHMFVGKIRPGSGLKRASRLARASSPPL